ncbi:RNB-like protein [Ostertagia ostertagi]
MELNVKQSGIVDRLVFSTNFKIRNRCLRRTVERYLRDDLSCGLHSCEPCSPLGNNTLGRKPNKDENTLIKSNHAVIVDSEVFMRFIDIFDSNLFQNVIITQNVWEFVKQKSINAYKKLNKFVYEDKDPRFSVFMSEFHHKTFVRPEPGLSDSLRREKVLYVCADYLNKHWAKRDIIPIILCAEDDVLTRLKDNYEYSYTVKDYVQGMQSEKKRDLLDAMAAYDSSSSGGKIIYENYLSHDEITKGIAHGTIKKGTFSVSRENYREAFVLVDSSTMTSWFIHGLDSNRAIDESSTTCDVEDLEMKADDETEADDSEEAPKVKRAKLTPVPTAKADILENQRIVVSIDQWPRDSRYPLGHYVRALGKIGDREIENEVLLLEHDIPHAPFSDGVLECLPSEDWKPDLKPPRIDLRHLTICSVDPLGCTDIDDALMSTVWHWSLWERTGMISWLLSDPFTINRIRQHSKRYAFSVIWTMTSDAEILDTKYHKSLICSKAALTYEKAQEFIDDPNLNDDVTIGLRGLMKLSKVLNKRRTANGALTLASSEVRFDMDWETRTPKSVQEKKHLDTHSMVEEFMLLANISVAEKILAEYPDCAMLRRHPVPTEASYKPLIEVTQCVIF